MWTRGLWVLYVGVDGENLFHKVALTSDEASSVSVLTPDGGVPSERALAAMWSSWCRSQARPPNPPSDRMPTRSVRCMGAMLPQPQLRFLLADEPGTGKTIMAGLYLREMRRNGLIRRALVVAPAGLVSKWQADFDHFFGAGLRPRLLKRPDAGMYAEDTLRVHPCRH
ncbi:SNF2-related protein [Nonomuraea sp. NPDC050153]|uniref:SNF2-related protein n=1 Tax=Nonomuraea sp. NPDC050153 TaxID=3364359 RepID=UPI0037BC6521